MNKLEALRYFCVASETLNFRETAQRLAVSPQAVTRMIAELESLLGESLFKRNTRNIRLTEFGEQFLPQAQQFLLEEERLFSNNKLNKKAMQGMVRITLPPLPSNEKLLRELLIALEPYPDIVLDWQQSVDKVKAIDHKIDIGLRICLEPEPHWIAQHICTFHEKIVASPKLIERLGMPKDIADLAQNYPLSGLMNPKLQRIWDWRVNNDIHFFPAKTRFISSDAVYELQAALAGRTCTQIITPFCQPYLQQGQLVELFPEIEKQQWHLYLYRPYQSLVADRVTFVFEQLKQSLLRLYGSDEM